MIRLFLLSYTNKCESIKIITQYRTEIHPVFRKKEKTDRTNFRRLCQTLIYEFIRDIKNSKDLAAVKSFFSWKIL